MSSETIPGFVVPVSDRHRSLLQALPACIPAFGFEGSALADGGSRAVRAAARFSLQHSF